MAQLLRPTGFSQFHTHTICSTKCRPSFPLHSSLTPFRTYKTRHFDNFRTRASFDTDSNEVLSDGVADTALAVDDEGKSIADSGYDDDKYPSGEFVYSEFDPWARLVVKAKMLFAWPWERVKKGSVLTMKIRGEVSLCCDVDFLCCYF